MDVVVVSAVAAVLPDYQVAQAAVVVARVAVVVELPRVAALAAVVVAPQHVHLAVAVALVAPDVQLAPHEPDARCVVAAGAACCLRRVVVAQQHDLEVAPQVSVVPLLAAVPFFVLPAAAARCCREPGPDLDARLAPGTSVP